MPESPLSLGFDLPFEAAIAAARARKVVLPEEYYGKIPAEARRVATTVSGLAALDQVQAVIDSVNEAVARGESFGAWQRMAELRGWKLPPGRLETIFRTNVQTAYSAGHWRSFEANKARRPYLMWSAINDSRVRPTHLAMDGYIAPIDDPIWQVWHPPAGYNCRCAQISLTARQAGRRGIGQKERPDVKPDKGFEDGKPSDQAGMLEALEKKMLGKAPPPIASAVRGRSDTLAPMSDPLPVRVAWQGFPDVVIHATESAVKKHPAYAAAKAGDVRAAYDLVEATLSLKALNALRASFGEVANVRWLPVIAEEAAGINRIPLAVAEALAARLGGTVEDSIGQLNSVGHTGASGWHRMAFPALFRGTVNQGANYVLVDDFVAQGGTLANLRGYVAWKGGQVGLATVLTGQSRSAALRVSHETLNALQSKHGRELENLWQGWFGYGLDRLSESEARYLLHAEDVGTIRVQLLAARRNEDAG